MPRSKVEVYVHFAWATKCRQPLLTLAVERVVYAKLREVCHALRCAPLAIGGVEDHVHLLCRLRSTVAVASLANQMKSVSSMAARAAGHTHFAWQHGYGAFSVSLRLLPNALSYVEQQKIRHATGKTLPDYEITEGDEEDDW